MITDLSVHNLSHLRVADPAQTAAGPCHNISLLSIYPHSHQDWHTLVCTRAYCSIYEHRHVQLWENTRTFLSLHLKKIKRNWQPIWLLEQQFHIVHCKPCCMSSLHSPLKNRQHTSVSRESPSLLIPINLSSEQGVGSQSWPLKFEHDLTLCLQLSNVSATAWLLSSSGPALIVRK